MPVAESSIKAETYARSKQIRTDTCGEGHIMISYQWSNQKTLIGIRNELHKHGLKVCYFLFLDGYWLQFLPQEWRQLRYYPQHRTRSLV